jgi:hypothetical protein
MKTIEVLIDDETTVVKTSGFAGAECTKATAALEKALGKTSTDTKTPEFYKVGNQTQKVGQ